MSNNVHGNNNEIVISNYLNKKTFKDLNLTMKEFIKYICKTKNIAYNNDTIIYSLYIQDNKKKEDILIKIENHTFGISLKMGSGNSTHQEKIEDFISFIKAEANASDEICNLWRLFIWCDGTLDGSGDTIHKDIDNYILCRFGANEFKNKYPEERKKLQTFLNDNFELLLNRFLFVGRHNSNVDFIYHGTHQTGKWVSKDEVINYQKNQINCKTSACLHLGSLSVQMWNACKKGNNEQKRGQLQVKYSKMKDDLAILMKNRSDVIGTFIGDLGESDLIRILNSNKNNQMWRILLPKEHDFSKYFMVKVSNHQFSSLSGKKVKTKSDAYVIKAELDRNFLLSKEFTLDENSIKNIKHEIVKDSGISIKIKDSRNFTYQKLTKNSFCKAFNNIINVDIWFISLLLYSNENELHKNNKIITNNGYTIEKYRDEILKVMNIRFDNTKETCNLIRKTAQEKIKDAIINNLKLAESIFIGLHWFKAPYYANFIYSKGQLAKNQIQDFLITTGSGRTKGNYTIEIKPK